MDKVVLDIYNQYKNSFELQMMGLNREIPLRDTPYFFRFNEDTLQYSLRSVHNDIVSNYTIKSGKQIINLIRLLGVPK